MLATTIVGFISGGAYALLGLCTLLTYRLVAVVNFAQAAVGALGAFVMVILYEHNTPLALAVILGVIAGAAAHGIIGFLMVHYLAEGNEEVKAAVTVVLFTAMLGVGGLAFGAAHPHNFPEPTAGAAFTVAEVVVNWTTVLILALALLFTIVPIVVLYRTRVGLYLRAVSSRPMTAQLVGIPAPRAAMAVWMSTGALTALAIMILAPRVANDFQSLSLLIIWAFAAALIGAFRSFWLTLVGGIGLGALQGFLAYFESLSVYRGVLPLVAIVLVLLWNQRHARWDAAA